MKTLKSLALVTALVGAGTVMAQDGACIQYKVSSSSGASGTFTCYVSAVGARTESAMTIPNMGEFSQVSLSLKDKPGIVYTIDDKAKTYKEVETKPKAATQSAGDVTVKIIGQEKVGIYNCTHCQVTRNGNTSDNWTTRDIAEYNKYEEANKNNKYFGDNSTQEAMKKAGADGFMVKITTKDRGADMTMELVKFEKQAIPDGKLTLPADYTKTVTPGTGTPGAPGAPNIDVSKLKDMTPEERQKFIEALKKQSGGN